MKIRAKPIIPKKGEFEKQGWEALKKGLVQHYEEKLKAVECSEHHQHPKVVVTGSLKKPEIKVTGCCQKLIDEAYKLLEAEQALPGDTC